MTSRWPSPAASSHTIRTTGTVQLLSARNLEILGKPRPLYRALHSVPCVAGTQFSTDSNTWRKRTVQMNEMNKTMNLGELGSDNERSSDDSDSELLARYQQYDDEAALAAIHSRHSDDLRAYASRELGAGSKADAEDMVQEAFESFHKNRKRYPKDTCVRKLLFRMVENCCGMYRRRIETGKRGHRLTYSLLESDTASVADQNERELKTHVDEMLDTLTPKQAEAIRLVRIDGHTAKSAAELLDLPPTTIRKRIKDGIDRLRKQASANG